MADVILPASSYIESGGTFTGMDRHVRHFPAAFPPPAGMTNLQIMGRLTEKMAEAETENGSLKPEAGGGSRMQEDGSLTSHLSSPTSQVKEVFEEIRRVNSLYGNVDPGSENKARHYWTVGCDKGDCPCLFCGSFATEDGKAHFAAYRVETGTYHAPEFSFNAIEHRYKDWIRKLFVKGGKVPVAVE